LIFWSRSLKGKKLLLWYYRYALKGGYRPRLKLPNLHKIGKYNKGNRGKSEYIYADTESAARINSFRA